MIMNKSIKLTMLSVSLAAVAITGCKNNSDDNKPSAGSGSGDTNVAKSAFVVNVPDIPFRGCSAYTVTYTDAKGNQVPETDITVSLIGQSSAKFKLEDGHLCALKGADTEAKKVREFEEAKVDDKALLEIKYKDGTFITKEVKVTNAVLKSVQLIKSVPNSAGKYDEFTSIQIPRGAITPEKLGFTVFGTDTAGNQFQLTEKNSKIAVTDKNGRDISILSFANNSEGKNILVTATNDLPYDKDSSGADYTIKVSSLDNSGNITANAETKLNIKVTEAVVEDYKIDLPLNLPLDTKRQQTVHAIFTDGTIKEVSINDFSMKVFTKDNKNISDDIIKDKNTIEIVPNSSHMFKTANDFLTLQTFIGNENSKYKINMDYFNSTSQYHLEKGTFQVDHHFVIGDVAPSLSISFQEFDRNDEFGYSKDLTQNDETLAKGGLAYDKSKNTPDDFKLADECVKLVSTLKVGTSVVDEKVKFNYDANKITDFTFDDSNIICAKKTAQIKNKWIINATYQNDIKSSNNLTVSVGEPITLNKFTFASETGSNLFYLNTANGFRQNIFAYYLNSDDTIDLNSKVDSRILDNLEFKATNNYGIEVYRNSTEVEGKRNFENPYFKIDKPSYHKQVEGLKVKAIGDALVKIGDENVARKVLDSDFKDPSDIYAIVQFPGK